MRVTLTVVEQDVERHCVECYKLASHQIFFQKDYYDERRNSCYEHIGAVIFETLTEKGWL